MDSKVGGPAGHLAEAASHKSNGGSQVKGLREIVLIHDLKKQGLSISAIARKVGSDQKTVRKYLALGLEAPVYGPRTPRPRVIEPFEDYLRERVMAFPDLTGARLLREIRAMGYDGGYTAVTDFLREVRPPKRSQFERRFETPPGRQARSTSPNSRSRSPTSPRRRGRSGCSRSSSVTAGGSGGGSCRVRTCTP
jgi:hypothetical protein